MTEGPEEEAATACFRTLTARLQQLFRRLPKSHLGSEKLQVLQSFHHEARLARGRSKSLQLGVLRGCWGSVAFPLGRGVQETSSNLVLNAELSMTPWPPLTPQGPELRGCHPARFGWIRQT